MKNTNILTYCISIVWTINGLFCKVLNLVPRHQQIVGKILGDEHSRILTIGIGLCEVAMAVWILSRYHSKLSAMFQIFIVLIMNIIEFIYAPELLLWGKFNSLFALLFIFVVYYNEFLSPKKEMK